MQMWQQQLMYKQLQEVRRQQQLQQLDQGSRQLSPLSQFSAVAKPATEIQLPSTLNERNQLPETLNEMPINDAYNYMWLNSFVGGSSNLSGNSQMFSAGNMNHVQPSCSVAMQNLPNGVIVSNDQSQAMQFIGSMPPQINQSFNGISVSGTCSGDQYSHLLGISSSNHDSMTKAAETNAEKTSYSSSIFQTDHQVDSQGSLQEKAWATARNFPGKHVVDNSSTQTSEKFQQLNNLQHSIQFQEFHGRQEQDHALGNLVEKQESQVGTSTGVASLDPIEQKLLFGTDDDDNWGFSFGGSLTSGMDGDVHGHSSENDYFGSFPSVHSGSWSALMQEAVQASTSDKGVQEEWSGLSYQKTEQHMLKPLITTTDNGKQPAIWDDSNLKGASSTSRPFPLFNDANTTPTSTDPINQHSFDSTYEESSRVLTEAPRISSFRGSSNKEFHQNQKFVEGSLQAQMPSTSRAWAGLTIKQHENNSEEIQFKSQGTEDGWSNQQNMPSSSVSVLPVNKLNSSKASFPMASGGDKSNHHESDGNLWEIGENHVNMNSGLQRVKSDIGSLNIQAEESSAGKFVSVNKPNAVKLSQDMHHQVTNVQQTVFGGHFALNSCVHSEDDKDTEENQNQPSRKPQTWEVSVSTAAERLGKSYEKKKEHERVVLGDSFAGIAAKDKYPLTVSDQYPSVSGGQKSSNLSSHPTVGSKMLQNSLGSLRNTVESSFSPNRLLQLQGLSNSVFLGSNNEGQLSVGKSQFSGHIVPNNPMDVSERIAVGAEGLQSRGTIPVCPSSSSFDGSTAQHSQNEVVAQASYNMLELLHKVDQTKNVVSTNASDAPAQAAADVSITHPHFDQSSNLRGFGLRLAPPSQGQPLPNSTPISQKSLNDINSGQSDHEAEYQGQAWLSPTSSIRPVLPFDEASKRENWDNIASLPGQKKTEYSEASNHFKSSATVSDSSSVRDQLQEQQQQLRQQHISSAKDHRDNQQQQWQQHTSNATTTRGFLDHSVKFPFRNQTNTNMLVRNASLVGQPLDCQGGSLGGQSVQTSLPPQAGRFPASNVASHAESRVPVGSQFSSGGTEHTRGTIAGFSQIISSGQQLPVVEAKSSSQPSVSGMSQQAGFSKMLHNVWTNISAQQHQAGIDPFLTPNVLQSIINHGRDTSSWGLPKPGDQVKKEDSAPPEHMDVSHESSNASQGKEAVLKPQQDVNKTRNGQDQSLSSCVLRAPLPNNVSTSSGLLAGRMSKPSDVQQQNYSLFHQVQSMKASESDINKMTGNLPKGAAFSSDSSQMNFNVDQGIVHGQIAIPRIPADGKVGAASHISFTSDAKMLSFTSSDSEEQNPNTSSAGHHIQSHMEPLSTSSTANVLGDGEPTQISPQMAPSWFDHYGTYQNGRMVAMFDAHRSRKASIQQYFLQNAPAKMDNSNAVEQRLDSSQVGSYRQDTSAFKIAPSDTTSSLLPPDVLVHGRIIRSKKRKIANRDLLPWHKVVMGCPQSLQSISMPELDWAQAANRLIEKVDDEAETMDDGLFMPQSRRRIILTTQLMHQLIPAVPAVMFKGEATSGYQSVTFSIAKTALADACSLVSSSESDSHLLLGNENTIIGEVKTSKKVEDDTFLKLMEDFIGRSKKLSTDFSRLERKTSMLDVRLECQELERFSIVNRLGKFHGRTHADGVDVSSTPGNVYRRIFPQRYITALPVPGNLPEGVCCLSL
ncbi:hypothetical protein MUK42_01224 [Musa troglodytarum]|uniref:Uncharacterized protein n=1 Tax=Musa troglodytarum TaxID=320322 RepID=A0A9E7H8F9_9LILI|nr:hypothetical protein MUK42_01224 [Musa troglodytarum]